MATPNNSPWTNAWFSMFQYARVAEALSLDVRRSRIPRSTHVPSPLSDCRLDQSICFMRRSAKLAFVIVSHPSERCS